jgi:hypothetical protein
LGPVFAASSRYRPVIFLLRRQEANDETHHPDHRGASLHFKQSLALLKTLRDEIRVELHLAGMDARDRWKGADPSRPSSLQV